MDPRDVQRQYGNWYDRFEEETMQLVFEREDDDGKVREVKVPAHYEVCDLCGGKGRHVNPSIDSNGITAEDMCDLGEDFEEEYFGGVYDVNCYLCNGKRVAPVVSWDVLSDEMRVIVDEKIDGHCEYVRECVSEARHMGEW